jgi:hypothetical protein
VVLLLELDTQPHLDDDGSGNLRIYYLTSGSTRTYQTTSVGTINYSVGTLTISSLSIVSSANSSGIIITVVPNSNDIVPVRNQLIEIDLANTSVIGANDIIESGGSSAGTGYTTTSSY